MLKALRFLFLVAISVCAGGCGASNGGSGEGGSTDVETASSDDVSGVLRVAEVVDRPNVLWFVLDTCRADHLSCYGYGRDTSPNIDRLAAQGTVFERNYAQGPNTLQSVGNYMTGRFTAVSYQDPRNLNIWFLREPPDGEELVSTIFKENGYDTAMFSSSPWYSAESRLGSSFDTFEWLAWGADVRGDTYEERNPGLFEWLENRSGDPFFLYVHSLDVHAPRYRHSTHETWLEKDFPAARDEGIRIWAEGDYDDRDRRHIVNLYDGGVSYADSTVGEVLGRLESLGLLEETVVVVGSDHGELLAEDGRTLSHPPKASHDELLHVPLIISGPGIPMGHRVGVSTQNADILPTLVDLLGLSTEATFHGASLRPVLEERDAPALHEFAYARSVALAFHTEPNRILIFDDFKFDVSPLEEGDPLPPNAEPRAREIVYAMPDGAGRRREVEVTAAQRTRAERAMNEVAIPLWMDKDAQAKEVPPYFTVNHGIPFNKEAMGDREESGDNLWGRKPGKRANEWFRDDLIISRASEEDSPGLIFVAKVPNGEYRVSGYSTTLEGDIPRGASFSFLVARVETDYRLFELPAAAPGQTNEAWFDIGTYVVSDGLFRYWIDEGNRTDDAVFGSLRFVRTDSDAVVPSDEELEAEMERLEALGYLN